MGLTIHWHVKDPKAYIEEKTARACVAFVKEIADREGWTILGNWEDTVNPSLYQKSGTWDEATNRMINPPNSPRTVSRTIGISVHPHKDSESVVVGFDLDSGKMCTYEDFGQNKYSYTSWFCKTHYAGFDTHRKVCRLLEAISKHFVELEVYDEGHYYGVWDDVQGKKDFGENVAFVHDMGKKLTDALGADGVKVISSEQQTDGWKADYIDHLASKMGGQNDTGKQPKI